jgi:DNA-binding response OmpR family regulator
MTEAGKKKILITEDDAAHLKILEDSFTRTGFQVLPARNGQEGLDIALRERPDVILLDRVMPVMDGITVMKKIRKSEPWGAQVPIILLTNLSASRVDHGILTALKYNMADYIVKSDYTLKNIVKKVKEKLEE